MSGDDPYVYPGTQILRNRLAIREPEQLERVERRLVTQRAREGVPEGDFDLGHLRAIHRHLFQDIYDWAGEIRTVEIAKGGHQFQARKFIETGMADIHRRVAASGYLRNLSRQAFVEQAGRIIGDVNYVHPFREGNGRTQLLYLKQLASRAGHRLDLTRLDRQAWMEASRHAHQADYTAMSRCIEIGLRQERSPARRRKR